MVAGTIDWTMATRKEPSPVGADGRESCVGLVRHGMSRWTGFQACGPRSPSPHAKGEVFGALAPPSHPPNSVPVQPGLAAVCTTSNPPAASPEDPWSGRFRWQRPRMSRARPIRVVGRGHRRHRPPPLASGRRKRESWKPVWMRRFSQSGSWRSGIRPGCGSERTSLSCGARTETWLPAF